MDASLKKQIKQLQAEAELLRLTRKQVLFCHYWVQSGEGAESAIRAGYKSVNAKVIASTNLTKVNMQSYIAKIKAISGATAEEKAIADSGEVLRFFTDVMRGKIRDQDDRDPRLADRIVCAKELQRINEVADKAGADDTNDKQPLTIEMYYGPRKEDGADET